MNKSDILHINSRYHTHDCFVIDLHTVGLRIRCGKDVDGVVAVYNDPYLRDEVDGALVWPYKKCEMQVSGETDQYKYFMCRLDCERRRLKYYFLIYSGSEVWQYSESGFTQNYSHDFLSMFFVPYIDKNRIHMPYEWLKNTVWYQILPSRFASERKGAPCGIKGITDKLPYLHQLGINGLYLNPVYRGKSYHKYDVIDYEHIDPDFGTDEDFAALCNAAHKMGMKVMLDISFTHCSSDNPFWQSVCADKEKSKYYGWFNIYENKQGELLYETFAYEMGMPKFNTENFRVIEYFCNNVIKYWMKKCKVDAWRIDVANEISDDLLIKVKNVMHDVNPEAYMVGEIWHNAVDWISKKRLDGVTNYGLSRAILSFVCSKEHSVKEYKNSINLLIHSYSPCQLAMCMTLLDSHDTPRLRYMCENDMDKFKLALFLLMTFPGTPSLYYGTERYMDGAGDPDCRRFVDWEAHSEEAEDVFRMISRFIHLRKEHPALANEGNFIFEHSEDSLLVYSRQSKEEKLYCVINSREYDVHSHLSFAEEKQYRNLINGDAITAEIQMRRLGFMILKEM